MDLCKMAQMTEISYFFMEDFNTHNQIPGTLNLEYRTNL